MNQEPSVLDLVKARVRTLRKRIFNPSAAIEETQEPGFLTDDVESTASLQASTDQAPPRLPWRLLLVLALGLAAQFSLEPRLGAERSWHTGLAVYVLAGLVLVWINWRQEWTLPIWDVKTDTGSQDTKFLRSSLAFIVSLAFSLFAFITFGSGLFTLFNLTIWLIAIFTMIRAYWNTNADHVNWFSTVKNFLSRAKWNIPFDRWTLLVVAVCGLVLFFRAHSLADIPSQGTSDHAEKLLDVSDVLNGQTYTFFPRNTGREFFQFYLTAGIILLFKTGLTPLSLKIGTVLAGLVTLFYIYKLGGEIANKRVGLLALVFAGIAYWPNLISRFGLRFPLYPLFYAPALYYLIRGLQTRNRNHFIISGLFVGLGLHGYSPFRMVPIVILIAIGLYLIHKQSEGYRMQSIWGLVSLGIISLIVFIPLLRYMTVNPDIVLYRAMTRLGDLEQPLPGPAWQIFLQNLRNSLTMFGWDNGEVWPISIPHRPVLDVVTAVFFHLGVVLMTLRYIRQRHWMDLFTLISIPMLMMPSILSLSFPGENPSLNRSAGAIVPVFLVVALAFDSFLTALESVSTSMWNKRFAWTVGVFLLAWASWQNYELVFNQYREQFDANAWNTTEMGAVVRDFADLTGSVDTAWFVGYPHWADSRLVMINAGYPVRDNAILPENFSITLDDSRPKLFLININDLAAMDALRSMYPNGWLTEYESKYENKNFMLFFVPGR